jgi:hypothetical protein
VIQDFAVSLSVILSSFTLGLGLWLVSSSCFFLYSFSRGSVG